MDSSVIQLEKGECEIPTFLLQYSYYLNRSATKQIILGFGPDSFKPYVALISFHEKKFLYFSASYWNFFVEHVHDCEEYLNKNAEICSASSNDCVFEINKVTLDDNNDTRQISITNVNFNCKIILNLEELSVLNQLIPFLSRMMNHFEEKWGFVKEFYRAYLLKCFIGDTDHLILKQFFKIESPAINYFRLFNEIPVLCRDKLKTDLEDLYTGGV